LRFARVPIAVGVDVDGRLINGFSGVTVKPLAGAVEATAGARSRKAVPGPVRAHDGAVWLVG
jgi:hypothetical protein